MLLLFVQPARLGITPALLMSQISPNPDELLQAGIDPSHSLFLFGVRPRTSSNDELGEGKPVDELVRDAR